MASLYRKYFWNVNLISYSFKKALPDLALTEGYKWKGNTHVRTRGVKLALLQESFIDYKGSVAGQLEEPTDQAIGCIVFMGNEFQMVHVLYGHL